MLMIRLYSGWLPYSSTSMYLGVLFTDNGIVGNDIHRHTLDKSKSVSIKLANFVTNNLYAPITVKFKVLKSCVNATILYAYETWSYSNLARIETLHRRAIKTCTKMMQNTPNDIVYIETGSSPTFLYRI